MKYLIYIHIFHGRHGKERNWKIESVFHSFISDLSSGIYSSSIIPVAFLWTPDFCHYLGAVWEQHPGASTVRPWARNGSNLSNILQQCVSFL